MTESTPSPAPDSPSSGASPQVYVSPAASGGGDGTSRHPFDSFTAALSAMAGEEGNGDSHNGPLDLVWLERPRDEATIAERPQRLYVIDPTATDGEGNGSVAAPWVSLEAAARHLDQWRAGGQLKLGDGQYVRLAVRGMFTPGPLERSKQRKEQVAKYVFLVMSLALVAPVLIILSYLVVKAWPSLSIDFLLTNPQDGMTAGGIWAPLVGTFIFVLASLAITAPIGILAGVYLNEYARDNWATRLINLAVVNLAGVPSIVHAMFGFGAFVLFAGMGSSLLAAACTVAVMNLPVIITSTREALAAVPMSFREACWNLGASRWQTIRTIVLPNSIGGILTGVILEVARAAGETAPILFTGAVAWVRVADTGVESFFPFQLNDTFMALSYHLYTLAKQIQNVPDSVQYGTAVVLIGLVLVVNSLSISLRVYLRSRKKW